MHWYVAHGVQGTAWRALVCLTRLLLPPRPQLSAGLSTEYSRKASQDTVSAAPLEDESNMAARYYINQILGMDEQSIQHAWSKVGCTPPPPMHAPLPARLPPKQPMLTPWH